MFDATNSQQQAGYNYAASNPITSSDPTGLHVPTCSTQGECGDNGGVGGACWGWECTSVGSGNNPGEGIGNRPGASGASGSSGDSGGARQAAIDYEIRAALEAAQKRQALLNKIAALLAKINKQKLCSSTLQSTVSRSQNYHPECDSSSWNDLIMASALTGAAATLIFGCMGIVSCPEAIYASGSLASCAVSENLCSLEGGAGAAESDVGSGETALRSDIRALCGGANSFAGETKVLMADGTSKPIDQVKVGDEVANTLPGADPIVGKRAHTVTAVHVTRTDHDYTDITVATSTGQHTITGTSHHLYWDATKRAWTRADALHVSDHLQTAGRGRAVVVAVRSYIASMVTYNLTVDHLHTYYVEAGNTPVLVHNCGGTLGGGEYTAIENAHGTDVAEGVDYMAKRMHDGSQTALDHEIPGVGHNLPALGDYLASWRGRLGFRDTRTGASVGYDQARGTLIVENSYMIHAYRYSYDTFLNSGRYVRR